MTATDPNPNSNLSEDTSQANDPTLPPQGVAMRLDYAEPSQLVTPTLTDTQADNHTDHVALFAQLNRPNVAFHANVTQPLLFRDGLMALFDVVSADYRYVPKDRTAYTAFMQMRRASANANLFASQRAYFDWLYNNDPLGYCVLDPIVQVHEDGVTFEVFSKDEGSYASLTFTHSLFDNIDNTAFGTTYIDYSPALRQGIEQIRSYRTTRLDIGQLGIGQQAVALQTLKTDVDSNVTTPPIIEKRINVAKSWIRSLLQVQSATQLSQDRFELDPVSLYNLLFELRMHADIKGKKRGLMIELVPHKAPVLTLEPFGIVVHSQSAPYQGKSAKLLRLWGRRRLALLKRLLPYTDKVSVTLLGQGMPSYWTLTGQGFHLTFAMTGFSQANWSQSLNFDLLLPKRPTETPNADSNELESIIKALQTAQDIPTLAKYLGKKPTEIRQNLLTLAQQGLVRYDLATEQFIYRPLTDTPLNMDDFAYHNLAEKQAYELVNRPKAISKFNVETLPSMVGSGGVAISADVEVKEDRRTYHSQLQLNDEGMVTRAECSCPQFLQHRLTQGVCSHLIAVRLMYASYDRSKDEKLRWQQSKLFSKRLASKSTGKSSDHYIDNSAELDINTNLNNVEAKIDAHANTEAMAQIYLTLNQKKLIIERSGDKHTGRQQLLFNRPEQAYEAFLKHIAQFESAGYLENQVI
ncbi:MULTISPECIES: hypothetical protein [unclassified Moraxella]|uniref:hypothetical protein n=1 Tax=unclassified Moraxella TaxID=2685852 RepID=UPI003AF74657